MPPSEVVVQFFSSISVINSPQLQETLLPLRILLGGTGIAMIIATVILFFKTHWFGWKYGDAAREFLTFRPFGLRRRRRRWQRIQRRLESGAESEYKLAVLDADKMLEEVFQKMQYGDTMGEQLDKIGPQIVPNIDQVREVHDLRDNLVYDPNYQLSLQEAQQAIRVYEQALGNLDII